MIRFYKLTNPNNWCCMFITRLKWQFTSKSKFFRWLYCPICRSNMLQFQMNGKYRHHLKLYGTLRHKQYSWIYTTDGISVSLYNYCIAENIADCSVREINPVALFDWKVAHSHCLFHVVGDQDAGCGGDPVRCAVDAIPHPGGGKLLPGAGLHEYLVYPLLSELCLHQQRNQPHHLQCYVAEIPCRLPQALPLRRERLWEAYRRHVQRGADLQRGQGHIYGGDYGPIQHRAGRDHGNLWVAWQEDGVSGHLCARQGDFMQWLML